MQAQEFAHLLDTHGPALILYARQWCDTPEDVVQETFLKLVRVRDLPRNPAAWLFRVVRNAAINARKATTRRQRRESSVARPMRWFVEPVMDGLDADKAVAALQGLPEEQREVVVARLWGGLSFEEIAEIAGSSASTAFRRYSAAIETLRQKLGAL